MTLRSRGLATGVDFGLVIPDQVIQSGRSDCDCHPVCGYSDLHPDRFAADRPTLVAQPWSKVGSSDTPGHLAQRTELAKFGQVGSAWGVTYNRVTNAMILAASLKRMSGLGTLGLGGIYRVPDVLRADGSIRSRRRGGELVQRAGTCCQRGRHRRPRPVGPEFVSGDRGIGAPSNPARDQAGFSLAARIGIGGVATTLDGKTLFITNLNDRQIYGIDVSDPPTPPRPSGVSARRSVHNQQLWALTVHSGRLYMGYVDTGAPGRPVRRHAADMNAYVVSVPVADAANPAGVVTAGQLAHRARRRPRLCQGQQHERLAQRRTHDRSCTGGTHGPTPGCGPDRNAGAVGFNTDWGWTHAYPQPVLSSLAFDIDGYLNLGFTDRTAIQSGNLNWGSDVGLPTDRYFETVANGDILVAAPVGLGLPTGSGCPTTATGPFVLECNGKVGSRAVRTAAASNPGRLPPTTTTRAPRPASSSTTR